MKRNKIHYVFMFVFVVLSILATVYDHFSDKIDFSIARIIVISNGITLLSAYLIIYLQPVFFKKILILRLLKAKDLHTAIELSFKAIPLGESIKGPQGKLLLSRNDKKCNCGAEITIIEIGNRNICTACWKGDKFYLKDIEYKFEDWDDKW